LAERLIARWRPLLAGLGLGALLCAAAYAALGARVQRAEAAWDDAREALDGVRDGAARLSERAVDRRRSGALLATLQADARASAAPAVAAGAERLAAAWRELEDELAAAGKAAATAGSGGARPPALDRAEAGLAETVRRLQLETAAQRQVHQAAYLQLRRRAALAQLAIAFVFCLLAAGLAALVLALGRRWEKSHRRSKEVTDRLRALEQQAERSDFDSRELFTTSNDLLFAVAPGGRFRLANPRWRAALGVAPEEVGALTFQELLHRDHRAVWEALLAAARRRERVPRFEAVLVASDSREVVVEGACWPRYEGDELVEIRGVMLDVTRQRQAEQQLVLGEERYRELFQNSQGLICMHDLEGRLLAVNPAAAEALGYTQESMVGMSLRDILLPELRPMFEDYLTRIRTTGLESGLMRVSTREGKHLVWLYRNVLLEKTGAEPYVLGYAIDLTERKRMEEELERSERKYRDLFDNSSDLIQSINVEGRFDYVNPHWLETLGYSAEEVRDLHFTDVLLPSEVEHCSEVLQALQAGQDFPDLETVFVAKDGRKVFVEGSASASFRNGRFVATRGFFHDVTQRRLLEAERQLYLDRIQRQNLDLEVRNREVERANRLKSEFLATMSHELRTPLTAIIGFSDLLDEDDQSPLSPQQRTYLGFVRKGARHLLQLINDVLDLSKIEAGRLEITPEDLALPEVVAEVLSTIGPLAASKRLQLESDVPVAGRVFADHVRLKQIFFNLLSNAVKFTPDGGRVSLSASTLGPLVCISVADSGLGIPSEQQEAIFSEFHQVGTSVKGVKEGTGLGLAIVRRLVEMHRGKIWVESEPGRGSVFTFLLPASRAAMETASELVERATQDVKEKPRRERSMVLVVDDDPAARELLVSYLRGDSHDTATAVSSAEAVAKARSLRPDLMTLDPALEAGGGWRILQDLKRQRATASLPILVVSVIDEKRKGFALGADGYLVKPVEKAQLLDAVRRHLRPPEQLSGAILVVDVEEEGGGELGDAVHAAGFRAFTARDGKEALRLLARLRPSAMVVNLLLPDLDGFQTILRLRAHPSLGDLPVVALAPEDLSLYNMDLLTSGPTRVLFREDALWREHLGQELVRMLGVPVPGTPPALTATPNG
jgi:PAS domain S-box-containing protein